MAFNLDYNLLKAFLSVLAVFLLIVGIGGILSKFIQRIFKKWALKTTTQVDDYLLEKAFPWFNWIILFVASKVAIEYVFTQYFILVPVYFESIYLSIILFFVLMFLFSIVNFIIDIFDKKYDKNPRLLEENPLLPLYKNIARISVFTILFIIFLRIWNLDILPFLGGLGIAGVIAGFAVKDSLENIFGGVSLILDKTLKVGDRVELADGTSGIVIDMSLRSTKIRTWDNESVIIPNGSLANSKIQNIGLLHSYVRCVVSFSVAYGEDIDKVKRIALKEIKKIKDVLKEPSPSVVFLDFGDVDLKLNANFWVDSPQKRYSAKLLAREQIYKALKKNKIKMGYQLANYSIAKKK